MCRYESSIRGSGGFHAWTGELVGPGQEDALERITQYIVRAPVSLERLTAPKTDGKVVYRSPKVHPRHKANVRIFDPLRV